MYQLFIRQKVFKIRDSYPVLDEEGRAVYQVEQDFKLIGNTVRVEHLGGQRSFVIDRKILTFLPRYHVSFHDGTSLTIKQNFTLFRKSIDVISSAYQLNLRGDLFGFNFDVFNGDVLVGHIGRKWLSWGDTFVISVNDRRFEEELLALMIVVDDIIDQEKDD